MTSPYQAFMTKVAEEHRRNRLRETAIDVGASLVSSRGLGGASVLGSAVTNAADMVAARYLAGKAIDSLVPGTASDASL